MDINQDTHGSSQMEERRKKIIYILAAIAIVVVLFLGEQTIVKEISATKGTAYLEEKEYEKAYTSFQKAEKQVAIGSKKNIRYYEGECLIYLGRYKDAIDVYDKIIDSSKEPRAYALKGLSYQQNKKEEEALACYQQAIEADKKDGTGYYYLYAYYVDQKEYEKALQTLEDAKKEEVTTMQQELAYARVVVYEKMLDYEKAYTEAKAYVKSYPDDKNGKREMEFLETR